MEIEFRGGSVRYSVGTINRANMYRVMLCGSESFLEKEMGKRGIWHVIVIRSVKFFFFGIG